MKYEPGTFTVLPNIHMVKFMKGASLAVYTCLVLHANSDGKSFPGYETIREETGVKSDATINNALKLLESIGVISVVSGKKKRTANLYQIKIVSKLDSTKIVGDSTVFEGDSTETVEELYPLTISINYKQKKKETKKATQEEESSEPDELFDLDEAIKETAMSNHKPTALIGIYLHWKLVNNEHKTRTMIQNKKQYRTAVQSCMRPAMEIIEGRYSSVQIEYARNKSAEQKPTDWNLYTILWNLKNSI